MGDAERRFKRILDSAKAPRKGRLKNLLICGLVAGCGLSYYAGMHHVSPEAAEDELARYAGPVAGLFGIESVMPPPEDSFKDYVYLVKRDDRLWDIAQKYAGDPYLWKEIADYNHKPCGMLSEGEELLLPKHIVRFADGLQPAKP